MSKDEIGSLLEALKTDNAEYVARQIEGLSDKKLRNALKSAGYDYSNKAPKGWHYVGEGEQPLDKSIFDYVKKSSPNKKSTSQTVHPHDTPSNIDFTNSNIEVITDSPIVHQQFTNDEVKLIKEMLFEWQRVATQAHEPKIEPQPELTLHDRIKELPQGDKTRKTIVIDSTIGNQLDEFCKTEKINKSDVLHLAIMDFLEKYNG